MVHLRMLMDELDNEQPSQHVTDIGAFETHKFGTKSNTLPLEIDNAMPPSGSMRSATSRNGDLETSDGVVAFSQQLVPSR